MESVNKKDIRLIQCFVPDLIANTRRHPSNSLRQKQCETPEESFSESGHSESDEAEGIKVPPRTFNAFVGRTSGQSPAPAKHRSRTQFYQPLSFESARDIPRESPCHELPSFNSSGPAAGSLSSIADSGSQQTYLKKETTETTESSVHQSRLRKATPARKIILCVSKKDGKFARSVLECISEVQTGESHSAKSHRPKRSVLSSEYITQSAKLPLTRRREGRRMAGREERNVSRFWRRQSVIKESVEENLLTEYWLQKDELDEKYSKLLSSLEVEEAAEIKLTTRKILSRGEKVDASIIMDIINKIREEYDTTRSLLIKQKIQVEEELIDQCHKKLAK